MNRARTPLFVAVAVVLVASACLAVQQPVPTRAPVTPKFTSLPVQATLPVQPSVAPTATLLNPSPAPSVTYTAFPSITPLPTATATATETPFGYKLTSTPTVPGTLGVETPDPMEGLTDDWGSPTRCTLVSKSPPDGMIAEPGGQLSATWVLVNSGTRTWDNSVAFIHLDGPRLASPDFNKKDLGKDVKVGQSVTTPPIWFYAPKTSGKYRSVWGLRKSGHVFCTFTVKITIP